MAEPPLNGVAETEYEKASFSLCEETKQCAKHVARLLCVKGGGAACRDGGIVSLCQEGGEWATAVAQGTIALLSDQKRGKSHQRKAPRPPLQTTSHPVELVAESNARQVCTIYSKIKKLLSISHHIISHTARANKVRRKKRANSTGWVGSRHGF